MPEKFRQKAIFMILNLIGTLAIMFIVLAATNRIGKADVEYVDKQDEAIKENFVEYKDEHQFQHTAEMQTVQKQLDIIVKWVENEGE